MSEERKRILIVIDWFLPGYRGGGPITSIANLVTALGHRYDFSIVTSDRDLGQKYPYEGIPLDSWITRPNYRIWYCSQEAAGYRHMRRLISETDYDLLYLNSMFSLRFTIFPLWNSRAAKPEVPVLLAPRGMLHQGALSLKPFKKKVFLKLLKWVGIPNQICFQATDEVEKLDILAAFGENVRVLSAPNLPKTDQAPFVRTPKAEGELRMVYLSRLSEKKGLHLLLRWLADETANIHLDVIGPDEEPGYWETCMQLIQSLPANIRVDKHPPVAPDEAAALLQAGHCFVLPTRGENFGHAIFEALSAGRPVLISDQTPWRSLPAANIGFDISLDAAEEWRKAIAQFARMSASEWEQWAMASWNFAHTYLKDTALVTANINLLEDACQLQASNSAATLG